MTVFEFLTQDVDTLAAGMYGLIEQAKDDVLEYIANNTGITVTRVNLAPEIRIAQIKEDLLKEHISSEEDSDDTEYT